MKRAPKRCWLMKTEPESFSIDDLARLGRSSWDGVRNYQSRNFMRDEMKVGDEVILYHSRNEPIGAAGLARVCKEGHPDRTALDPRSKYFDPKATEANPIWVMVDVEFVAKFPRVVTLAEMKADEQLDGLMVIQRGARLSIQPVSPAHFQRIVSLSKTKGRA